jgi:predicted MFS family arabinose efflux permease
LLPESIDFLLSRQPKGALEKANRLLRSMGQPAVDTLPARKVHEANKAGVRGLLTDGRATGTILLWMATISGFMTLYFVISWIPKLAVEAGLPAKDAIYAGAIYNIGAFVGVTLIGIAGTHFDLRRLILGYMSAAAVTLVLFGSVTMPLIATLATAFLIGVFVQGGFNGCYPLAASLYPPEARGTGIGWAMGVGRIGAVIGPMLGGFLLAAKVSLPVIFGVFAVPAVIAGICAAMIRLPKAD